MWQWELLDGAVQHLTSTKLILMLLHILVLGTDFSCKHFAVCTAVCSVCFCAVLTCVGLYVEYMSKRMVIINSWLNGQKYTRQWLTAGYRYRWTTSAGSSRHKVSGWRTSKGMNNTVAVSFADQLTHTLTHICFTALWTSSRIIRMSRYQNQSRFYWSKRQWVAVASAVPYANRHLCHRQITTPAPTTWFLRAGYLPVAQPTASKHWNLPTNSRSNYYEPFLPRNAL